jgi:hypothetical protein
MVRNKVSLGKIDFFMEVVVSFPTSPQCRGGWASFKKVWHFAFGACMKKIRVDELWF